MTEGPAPQTPTARLATKLQALFDTLPPDEQRLMARLLQLAVEQAEVEGFSAGRGDREGTAGERARRPIDDFRVNLGLYLERDPPES